MLSVIIKKNDHNQYKDSSAFSNYQYCEALLEILITINNFPDL